MFLVTVPNGILHLKTMTTKSKRLPEPEIAEEEAVVEAGIEAEVTMTMNLTTDEAWEVETLEKATKTVETMIEAVTTQELLVEVDAVDIDLLDLDQDLDQCRLKEH